MSHVASPGKNPFHPLGKPHQAIKMRIQMEFCQILFHRDSFPTAGDPGGHLFWMFHHILV